MISRGGLLTFAIALAMVAGPARAELDAATLKDLRTAIDAGRRSIDGKDYSFAASTLKPVVENERTPPELMAQGFYYRGLARAGLGQTAAALSDFSNAIWLSSLPSDLEARAYFYRGQTNALLGRTDEARLDYAEARRIGASDTDLLAAMKSLQTGTDGAATGSLPAKAQDRVPGARPGGAEQTAGFAFGIQLGALADTASARAAWDDALATHGDLLSGLAPQLQAINASGRGLVRLRAGPLASLADSRTLCEKLRARGQDCFPVGH